MATAAVCLLHECCTNRLHVDVELLLLFLAYDRKMISVMLCRETPGEKSRSA